MKRYVLFFDVDQTLWHKVKTEQQGRIAKKRYQDRPDVLEQIPQVQKLLTSCQTSEMNENTFNGLTGSQ